tara:strand:- start:610 stop:783 length:174 start_codon:yes stop_codon:yes gene_type:complete
VVKVGAAGVGFLMPVSYCLTGALISSTGCGITWGRVAFYGEGVDSTTWVASIDCIFI